MRIVKQFFNILVSTRCVICGKYILEKAETYPLCIDCESGQQKNDSNICLICGYPLISETDVCLRCRDSKYNYISNRSVFKYFGDIKELIYQYKFKNRKQLSQYFAKHLADVLLKKYSDCIIVPVPGRKTIKKKKGWEHIDLLSNILKLKYKLPVQKILIRKGTKAQKTLSREKRVENLQQNVNIKRKINLVPENIVLIDDIFTTGTTINECAGILKSAGTVKIYSVTIAID